MKSACSHSTVRPCLSTLSTATNSVSSLNWSNVTTGIQDDVTTKTLIITAPAGNCFYRLSK